MKYLKGNQVPQVEFYSTGSYIFDFLTGGGIPKGKITEIFGSPSSGKTSFILNMLQANPEAKAIYFDFEQGLDKDFLGNFSLPNTQFFIGILTGKEATKEILKSFEKNDIVIVDSLSSIAVETEALAQTALVISQFLKLVLRYLSEGKTLILLNQLRTQSLSGNMFVVESSGGYALKHFTHLRVRLEKKKIQNTKIEVEVKVIKSKLPAPPYNKATLQYDFLKKRVDTAFEIRKLAEVFGLIESDGSEIIIKETGEKVNSRFYARWFEKEGEFLKKRVEESLQAYYQELRRANG